MDEYNLPTGGTDYPRTLSEFDVWFSSERDCLDFISKLRWPDGFRCPQCGGSEAWQTSRGLSHCRRCGAQTSVTAGTIFHGSRKPLLLWFRLCGIHEPEVWGERLGAPAGLGSGIVRNSVALAAQIAPGHGSAGTRSAFGVCSGG